MFTLQLQHIGKRFQGKWLFRELTFTLQQGEQLALLGMNGAGKSTLMRIIAGQLTPTEGKVVMISGKKRISHDFFYPFVSWTSPAMQLYPDLTLKEHIDLHFQLKNCLLPTPTDMIDLLQLQKDADKKLRFYSSGMLQRVKVGLALFSQSQILLLDEPTANMDTENAQRILDLIQTYVGNRVYLLASNLEREYAGMERLDIHGMG